MCPGLSMQARSTGIGAGEARKSAQKYNNIGESGDLAPAAR
jgi:hypothetical protein